MATVQTIATTLTADARPAITSLRTFDAEVGKAFSRLDAMNKRVFSSGGGIDGGGGGGGIGGGSRNAARGLLELSRGVEDAAVVFGTSGFSGAIRASSNNLSQMAFVMGGPLAGAIAGFAAAGVSLAAPYIASLFSATEQTKKLKEETEKAIKAIGELFDARVASNVRGAGFAFDLKGMGDSKSAKSAIEQRQKELRELEEKEFFNRQQREEVFGKGGKGAFSKEIEEELNRLDKEGLSISAEKLQVQNEITRLKERQLALLKEEKELQKQKDQEEFAAIIRKFQEEDEQEEQRKRDDEERKQRRKEEQDQEKLEGLLKGRLQGLGGKVDPLEGMDIPPELRDRIGGLLGEIDALDKGGSAKFAQVATADSQSLLRAQEQAKQAAIAKKQRDDLIKKLEDLIREVKGLRRDGDDQDLDDVNLI